jgi:hypothetical protein
VLTGPICEHGYGIVIRDKAVRHMATGGICIDRDAAWRASQDPDRDRQALHDEQGVGRG